MWKIYETKFASKQLNSLPKQVIEKYEFWKNVATISGPTGISAFPGFKDHSLKGKLVGLRSSRLNLQYRIIYLVDSTRILIEVIEVNAHDYKGI